jgi:hypothetical protein
MLYCKISSIANHKKTDKKIYRQVIRKDDIVALHTDTIKFTKLAIRGNRKEQVHTQKRRRSQYY